MPCPTSKWSVLNNASPPRIVSLSLGTFKDDMSGSYLAGDTMRSKNIRMTDWCETMKLGVDISDEIRRRGANELHASAPCRLSPRWFRCQKNISCELLWVRSDVMFAVQWGMSDILAHKSPPAALRLKTEEFTISRSWKNPMLSLIATPTVSYRSSACLWGTHFVVAAVKLSHGLHHQTSLRHVLFTMAMLSSLSRPVLSWLHPSIRADAPRPRISAQQGCHLRLERPALALAVGITSIARLSGRQRSLRRAVVHGVERRIPQGSTVYLTGLGNTEAFGLLWVKLGFLPPSIQNNLL